MINFPNNATELTHGVYQQYTQQCARSHQRREGYRLPSQYHHHGSRVGTCCLRYVGLQFYIRIDILDGPVVNKNKIIPFKTLIFVAGNHITSRTYNRAV